MNWTWTFLLQNETFPIKRPFSQLKRHPFKQAWNFFSWQLNFSRKNACSTQKRSVVSKHKLKFFHLKMKLPQAKTPFQLKGDHFELNTDLFSSKWNFSKEKDFFLLKRDPRMQAWNFFQLKITFVNKSTFSRLKRDHF